MSPTESAPASEPFRLQLRFWGVRGSTPTPSAENLGHGGNTPCIEFRLPGGEVFIFDGGTGLRNLGASLPAMPSGRTNLNLFFTHFHWDHMQGLPFFQPLYEPGARLTFHSAHPRDHLKRMLSAQMQAPFFPVEFAAVEARCEFEELAREGRRFGDLVIRPFPLNHPQGSAGYRLEVDGATMVYASDLEHGDPTFDRILRESCEGADVLIYDAHYSQEEYETHRGWGHSTWLEATRVANDARVKHLVLFHHEPVHSDAILTDIVAQARRHFENTSAAREGGILSV